MAKIAVELKRAVALRELHGTPGYASGRTLSQDENLAVNDVLCTSGPGDRRFEELHTHVSIALVVAGTFQYRSRNGHALMTPGSVMLGSAGHAFECGHEHAVGDRCIAFKYKREYFEEIASDAGASPEFRALRLPPIRTLSPLFARVCAGVVEHADVSWEELGLKLAAETLHLAGSITKNGGGYVPSAAARVTKVVRMIEERPEVELTINELARSARLSPYHFLRVFEEQTGLTPHQFIRRTRLRNAAIRLATENEKVLDIALDSGFGDVSNFNRAFRSEFGASPRGFRNESSAI